MFAFIIAVLALIASAVAFYFGFVRTNEVEDRNKWGELQGTTVKRGNGKAKLVAAGLFVVGLIGLGFSTIYTQNVGQSVVLVNAGGGIAGEDITNGPGFKAPWQRVVKWDLFTRDVSYGDGHKGETEYRDGEIQGVAVTSSVARGAQVVFDMNVTYNVKAEDVLSLYTKYRDQDRFTRQVVEPAILSAARSVPTKYDPVVFRGEKRDASGVEIQEAANARLAQFGIEVSLVTIQGIRFSEQVEESIKNVEVAQQREAEAQANLRAAEVEAQKQVATAKAEAEANRLLAESLSSEILESKRLDTLRAIGEKGNMIITDGGTSPLVTVPAPTQK